MPEIEGFGILELFIEAQPEDLVELVRTGMGIGPVVAPLGVIVQRFLEK